MSLIDGAWAQDCRFPVTAAFESDKIAQYWSRGQTLRSKLQSVSCQLRRLCHWNQPFGANPPKIETCVFVKSESVLFTVFSALVVVFRAFKTTHKRMLRILLRMSLLRASKTL